jgi:hypothetical protein
MNEGLSSAKDWEDRHRPALPILRRRRRRRKIYPLRVSQYILLHGEILRFPAKHPKSGIHAVAISRLQLLASPLRPPSVVFSVASNKRSSSLRRWNILEQTCYHVNRMRIFRIMDDLAECNMPRA